MHEKDAHCTHAALICPESPETPWLRWPLPVVSMHKDVVPPSCVCTARTLSKVDPALGTTLSLAHVQPYFCTPSSPVTHNVRLPANGPLLEGVDGRPHALQWPPATSWWIHWKRVGIFSTSANFSSLSCSNDPLIGATAILEFHSQTETSQNLTGVGADHDANNATNAFTNHVCHDCTPFTTFKRAGDLTATKMRSTIL